MIKEEYVTLPTAKLLKQEGFPQTKKMFEGNSAVRKRMAELCPNKANVELCTTKYWFDPNGSTNFGKSRFNKADCYACPTQTLAMRWLREKHEISVEPHVTLDKQWMCDAWDFDTIANCVDEEMRFPSYEAAAEAGIQAACKYLIEKGGEEYRSNGNNRTR